ncbi:MAG TPA: hypothetical protein VGT60_04555 [Candidatus Limnocylindria bacterium]|nr:hypothetical protein [Candidatus Limnocylindria bacterium]
MRRWPVPFALANAAALAVVAFAGRQAWIATAGDTPVPSSLFRLWLPLAYLIAALLSALVATALDGRQRARFLARHFALYLGAPLGLLLAYVGRPILNEQLGAIYLLVGFALAAHALHGVWLALDRLTDLRGAALVGATLLALGLIVLPYHRTVQPTASDEPHYLIVMQSLVLDHDLDLANDYAGDRYLGYYPAKITDIHGIHVGAAIYSIRDLGLVFLGVIPFAIGERTGVLALLCVAGALLAVQVFLLLRDLAFDRRVALLATAAVVFTHPVLTYTAEVYPELLAALALVTAVRALRRGPLATGGDLALASLAVGTLPWLTTRAWFAVIGVGLIIAYRAFRPFGVRRVVAGAAPFAALLLLLCYLNYREFGLFMPSAGYYLIRDQQQVLAFAPQVGALGLFFDRTFGLIGRAPVYLLAFLGLAALWGRRAAHGDELLPLALGWLLSFVYIADIAYWWADGSPSSRYLVATIPFLAAAVAGGIETVARAGRWRSTLSVAAWAAAGWSLYAVFSYAMEPTLGYDLATDVRAGVGTRFWLYVGKVLRPDPGSAFPSLVVVDGRSIALSLAWLAVAIALAVAGWRISVSRRTDWGRNAGGPALHAATSIRR